jgi:hypothetical protein
MFVGRGFRGCGKNQFKAAFGSTGTLACAGFAAFIIDAQPRVAALLNFFVASSAVPQVARMQDGFTGRGKRQKAVILSAGFA